MDKNMAQVTIIIPNYNGIKYLGVCLDSLERQTVKDFRVLLVDNGSTDGSVEEVKKAYPKVDIFSDNIILSNEIVEDMEERAFVSIIFFSALLQLNMWINNLLVRGGISYGDFFSDEKMIWGNALIGAYKLEGQIAIYPRIIVEPEIAEIIRAIMKPEKGRLLCEDFDGIYFVDPFGIKRKEIGVYLIDQFINDNAIRLKNSQGNLKIYQKINWLQQYFCEKRREMIDT